MKSLLNGTKIGQAAQHEFAKLATLGSGGRLEVSLPWMDDDRIDFMLHLEHEFSRRLHIQAKCLTGLVKGCLYIHFEVARDRLRAAADFWYFFALLDLKAMAFRDPVFLVPSKLVHEAAAPMGEGKVRVGLSLNMAARARDRWEPYRVSPLKLGARLVEIIEGLPRPTPEAA